MIFVLLLFDVAKVERLEVIGDKVRGRLFLHTVVSHIRLLLDGCFHGCNSAAVLMLQEQCPWAGLGLLCLLHS